MKSIDTNRLHLRMYREDDAESLYAYACDPDVGPHAGWKPHESPEEALRIIREIFIPAEAWAIIKKEDEQLIGSISLEEDRFRPEGNSREMGYSLAKKCWGNGYMTEAALSVLKFAFMEMELDQVGICTSPANVRSQHVIKKCGFVYEGTIRRALKEYTGNMRDSMVFSMTREEWKEKQATAVFAISRE